MLLADEHGGDALLRFSRAVAGGVPTDAALREVLGTRQEDFVLRWKDERTVRARR